MRGLPRLVIVAMTAIQIVCGRLESGSRTDRVIAPRQSGGGGSLPLVVKNSCEDTIWPGVLTQGGTGPSMTGFELTSGSNQTLSVSQDWQGRVWGRTNCSFSAQGASNNGRACTTGDCGGTLTCQIAGAAPATLAEFALAQAQNQDFYDLSLVDGYNLPMAIVILPNGDSQLESISQATTNPSCVGSVGDLAPSNFNPYANNQQFLGTSSSDPLDFETTLSASTVAQWCPWDLQVFPPTAPGDGVYPYPDGNVQRPAFDPCFSACAKYNTDQYCCTGSFNRNCQPNYYSKAAKSVCPDAYSFADDDESSTFAVPAGGGFQVVFCPGGRSTDIIASRGTGAIQHSNSTSGSSPSHGRLMIDGVALKTALGWTLGVMMMQGMFAG